MRWTALLLTVFMLSACSEETVTEPDTSFRVEIEVVDGTGAVLPDMNVNVVNDVVVVPLAATSKQMSQANLTIPFAQIESALVRVFIENINGERVASIIDEVQPSGFYNVNWDGRDDEGVVMPSGLYTVRLVAFRIEDTTKVFDERRDVFLLHQGDEFIAGVTDSDGILTLIAESLFPGLMFLEPLTATDENGAVTGELEILEGFTIYVWPASGGVVVHQSEALVAGPNSIRIVYDPELSPVDDQPTARAGTSRVKTTDKDEGSWELRNPYPNPFN